MLAKAEEWIWNKIIMGLSCGARWAKGLLVTFNIFFWVSGCFLFAVGVYFMVDKEKVTLLQLFILPGFSYSFTHYLALVLIGLGGLVFLMGFCGCCGAIRENRGLLITYFIFLFLVMCGELAVGILSVIFQDKSLSHLENLSTVLKDDYGIDSQKTEAFDFAQTKFNCCGIFGPEDYDESTWKTQNLGKGDTVSITCCVLTNDDHLDPKPINSTACQLEKSSESNLFRHNEGCIAKLEEFIKQTSILFVAIGCGVAVLEIFGMVFAVCLCKEV